MMSQIQAVIFDMDGTLLDTEKHYIRIGLELTKEMGYPISREQLLTMRSLNRKFSKPMLLEQFGEGFDFEYFHATRRARLEEALKTYGIEKKPGADDILEALHERGIETAVATATNIERAELYLKEVELYDKFDKILSVSHVKYGKPRPDVYIEACRQLGRNPVECLAVEDSPNGVKSAYDAGVPVIFAPDLTQPDEAMLPMIHGVANHLLDILNYI